MTGTLGCALSLGAHVRAGVEPSARGALVDPSQADLAGLVQAAGVLAAHQHLVREWRAINAAVGQPAGRTAGAAASLPARLGPGGCLQELLEVDVFVELLDLSVPLV